MTSVIDFDPIQFTSLFAIASEAFIKNTKNANYHEQTKGIRDKEVALQGIITRLLDDYSKASGINTRNVILRYIIQYAVMFSRMCIDIEKNIIGKVYMCDADIISRHMASDSLTTRQVGCFFQMVDDLNSVEPPEPESIPGSNNKLQQEKEKKCKEPLQPAVLATLPSFNQIVGLSRAKQDFSQMYVLPYKYENLFMHKTRGVLLYGPPGTGKTLLAKAAAKAFDNCKFFAPSPGELKGKYVGETEKNIEHVFKCAREALARDDNVKHVIIFLDEFDGIGGLKSKGPNMILSVNALLQQMDGISSVDGVSVIASTNLPWELEDAILRRFDSKIFVDIADNDTITHIIKRAIAETFYFGVISKFDKKEKQRLLREADMNPRVYDEDNMTGVLQFIGSLHGSIESRPCTDANTDKPTAIKDNDDICVSNMKDIQEIAAMFAPQPDGVKIKASILTPTGTPFKLTPEIIRTLEGPPIFGYSPSDVTKIVSNAIGKAALRALTGPLRKNTLSFGDDTTEEYYVPVSYTYIIDQAEQADLTGLVSSYTVYVTKDGRATMVHQLNEYLKTKTKLHKSADTYTWKTGTANDYTRTINIEVIREEDHSRVINLTLTRDDFTRARAASTVQNMSYVNLLMYNKYGIIPK